MAVPNRSKPLYDIKRSYLENATDGPFFDRAIPERTLPPISEWADFLGTPVASRIGIAAGPLLNSRWVALAAALGYDVLVYKTIRSYRELGHATPNIVHVDTGGQLDPDHRSDVAITTAETSNPDRLAITNSFGNPSRGADYLAEDIPAAFAACGPGQALVVSIFGTPESGSPLIEDFRAATRLALEGGARILEANFSCPNLVGGEGSLYESLSQITQIGSAVCKEAGEKPMILKIGPLLEPSQLQKVLVAAARAGFRAISGINTVRMKVVTPKGVPALGADRLYSGVCGSPIRPIGLEFVQKARAIIDRERLDLTLIGVGGITRPEHFTHYLNAGADFAQTATGMMWDPYLATHYHQENQLCLSHN